MIFVNAPRLLWNCYNPRTISPGTVTGHASAAGALPADVDFLNGEVALFSIL
jgi:hypothetical protein